MQLFKDAHVQETVEVAASRGGSNGPSTVIRPKDAAVSCARLWSALLIVLGVIEVIIGAVLLDEWGGVGSFWVGAVVILAGVAGMLMKRSKPSGGGGTAFLMALSALGFLAAVLSVVMSDGLTYLVVNETQGNCFDTNICEDDTCSDRDCICWEPDETVACDAQGNVRYCINYAGGDCGDIGDSKQLLLGSSVTLLIIAVVSFFAFLVSVATCFCCKRIIIENPRSSSVA